MPGTHSSEEQNNPAIAVLLGAVSYPAGSFFVKHYVMVGDIVKD
jgi:hypothetical protein